MSGTEGSRVAPSPPPARDSGGIRDCARHAVPCVTDALLGSEIAQVTGNDVDSGPALWYVLSPSGQRGPFSVGRYGGRLSLTGPLDYEQRDRYHLQLLAHDGPHQGHANLTVLVEDVNDNAPTFSQSLYQVLMPGAAHVEGKERGRKCPGSPRCWDCPGNGAARGASQTSLPSAGAVSRFFSQCPETGEGGQFRLSKRDWMPSPAPGPSPSTRAEWAAGRRVSPRPHPSGDAA